METGWETPTAEGLLAAHRRWFVVQDELIVALREDVRWWQFAFLLVTVQFAVMFIAAMWGWLR